jgi:chromosome segregation ATPase
MNRTGIELLDELLLELHPYDGVDDEVSVAARAIDHIKGTEEELKTLRTRLEDRESRIAELTQERNLYDARRRVAVGKVERWRSDYQRLSGIQADNQARLLHISAWLSEKIEGCRGAFEKAGDGLCPIVELKVTEIEDLLKPISTDRKRRILAAALEAAITS